MSELYGTTYGDRARPQAISTAQLLGQVMFLVAIALAFAAFGTWVGRDLAIGTARILSFAGFGMLLVSSFAGARFRVGTFAMAWLFATAFVIGLGLGPVIAYFATVDQPALTQAFAGTAATVAGGGRARLRALQGPRAAGCGRSRWSSSPRASARSSGRSPPARCRPVVSGVIYLLSAALIVVDFNYLRKHGTENDAIWLATGIFVSIVNIFVSLLNIFSSR